MRKKHSILILSLICIFLFGCGNANNFKKDFELVNINEGNSGTSIELNGMGGLPLANGRISNDILTARKYLYGNLTIYYRLFYQRMSAGYNISPQRITFLIDGQKYIVAFLGSDKSDGSELAWVNVEPSFLKKIANAKEVLLRVEGTDRAVDYAFNEKYLYFFKRFYKECVLSEK